MNFTNDRQRYLFQFKFMICTEQIIIYDRFDRGKNEYYITMNNIIYLILYVF